MLECCLQSQETDRKFVLFSMVGSSCEHFTELTAELEGLCLVSKIFGCFYTFKICLLPRSCKSVHFWSNAFVMVSRIRMNLASVLIFSTWMPADYPVFPSCDSSRGELQNHWGGKAILEIIWSIVHSHWLRVGLTAGGYPGLCPVWFWIFLRTSFHNLFQCLITLKVKYCFLKLKQDFLYLSLHPLPLLLSLGTTEKNLALSSYCPIRYLLYIDRCPWAFSFPDWTVLALSGSNQISDAPNI